MSKIGSICTCTDYSILDSGSFTHRNKEDGTVHVKELIHVIKDAVRDGNGLSNDEYDELLKSLYHQDIERHNQEVKTGLAKALFKLLEVVLPNDETGEQVGYLVTAFALVFQCSNQYKLFCYNSIGRQLIPLLLQTCDMCIFGKVVREHSPELILATVTKILGMFCKLSDTRKLMAGDDDFLDSLVDIIDCKISPDARVYAIWAVSILALDDESRLTLATHPDIIDTLIEAAKVKHEMTRKEISAAILNISAMTGAHTLLAERPGFLGLVHRLLTGSGDPQVRAAGTVRNIASSEGARSFLVDHDGGALLAALCALMRGSRNETLAARAAGAVKNLSASARPDVRAALLAHPEFLGSVGAAAAGRTGNVRNYATVALANLAECCHHPDGAHPQLLEILVAAAAASLDDDGDEYARRISGAYLAQASRPENVMPMVRNKGIVEGMSRLSSCGEAEARTNATRTLEKLASNPEAKAQLLAHLHE